MHGKGIYGHVSVDCISHQNTLRNLDSKVYAVDLRLGMSEIVPQYWAFDFLSNGHYDKVNGKYYIDFKDDESIDEGINNF